MDDFKAASNNLQKAYDRSVQNRDFISQANIIRDFIHLYEQQSDYERVLFYHYEQIALFLSHRRRDSEEVQNGYNRAQRICMLLLDERRKQFWDQRLTDLIMSQ